jgi:hypothetical protein
VTFLHHEFWGGSDVTAVVAVDHQCNVLLLSDADFRAYRSGQSFRYHGGWAARSPVQLTPPHDGHWHIVIDLGGTAGTVRADVRLVRRRAPAV